MKLSQEQWLANLRLSLKYWSETPPHEVVENLDIYRSPAPNDCGTVACFGGHLAKWASFKEMGVTCIEETGAPMMMYGKSTLVGDVVAEYLFGDRSLFLARHPYDPPHMTDHEVITWRIEQRIAELESQASSV